MKFLPITLAAVTLGLAAASVVPAFAQAAPGAPGRAPGMRMNKVADALGLSDAQKARMQQIAMGARKEAQAMQANTLLTPQAKQAKMMSLRTSATKQMMMVLTPAQRQKVKAMHQQRPGA